MKKQWNYVEKDGNPKKEIYVGITILYVAKRSLRR